VPGGPVGPGKYVRRSGGPSPAPPRRGGGGGMRRPRRWHGRAARLMPGKTGRGRLAMEADDSWQRRKREQCRPGGEAGAGQECQSRAAGAAPTASASTAGSAARAAIHGGGEARRPPLLDPPRTPRFMAEEKKGAVQAAEEEKRGSIADRSGDDGRPRTRDSPSMPSHN
jgi:hypothetical protein